MANRRQKALENEVRRLQQEVVETTKLADDFAAAVDEMETERQVMQAELDKRDAVIVEMDATIQESKHQDQVIVKLHEQLLEERDRNTVFKIENSQLHTAVEDERLLHRKEVIELTRDIATWRTLQQEKAAATVLPAKAPASTQVQPPSTTPTPNTAPVLEDEEEASGTEEDDDDEEEDEEVGELRSSNLSSRLLPQTKFKLPQSATSKTHSTNTATPKTVGDKRSQETNARKLAYRTEQKQRLKAKKDSYRRGSFFGASKTLGANTQAADSSSTDSTSTSDQKDNDKQKKTKKLCERKDKRRNTRFGIYQAPRYHRASVVLDSFFGNQQKITPEDLSSPLLQQKGTKWGKKQRKGSVGLFGLEHARVAQSQNPLTIARSHLALAGLSCKWSVGFGKSAPTEEELGWAGAFGKFGTMTAEGESVLELTMFKTMIRKGCNIPKEITPDFLVRRIYDLVDVDRIGEINANDFQKWLDDDGGAIRKIASPSKMFNISDSDSDSDSDSEEEQNVDDESTRRLSVKEREQMRMEGIRHRISNTIKMRIDDGTVRAWKAVFRSHDHLNSGNLELHTFTSSLRNKFKLSSDPELGGVTDRELRDIFFEVDRRHSGYIPIEPLLVWLFKGKDAPDQGGQKRARVREGGRASSSLRKPLAFGRSTSDMRKFFSPLGVEIKGHHAMPKKTRYQQLGPSHGSVSRLHRNKEEKDKILREREIRRKKEEMRGCTFSPNVPRARSKGDREAPAAAASPISSKSWDSASQPRRTTKASNEEDNDPVYSYVQEEETIGVEGKRQLHQQEMSRSPPSPKVKGNAPHRRRETLDILFGSFDGKIPQEGVKSSSSLNREWEAAYEHTVDVNID